MATVYKHRFTVKGRHELPLDMLRYDSAYPASQIDAGAAEREDEREVTLERTSVDKNWTPTYSRWSSFGWVVIGQEPARKWV